MNSLTNRDWEIYNIDSFIKSSECNNKLINKNIDNYFNKLISKPIDSPQYKIINKTNYTFNKFYYEYIEHNMLFIVLLIGIIIFFIINYYSKDNYTESFDDKIEDNSDNNNNDKDNSTTSKNDVNKYNIKINKLKKIKKLQQIQLLKYKNELDNEKQKILSIIDELSSINDDNCHKEQYKPKYLNEDINLNYTNNYANNYIQSQKFLNQIKDNDIIHENIYNNSEYYDVNKKNDDELNSVDGLYVVPPFS